jgi:hypothetical protein
MRNAPPAATALFAKGTFAFEGAVLTEVAAVVQYSEDAAAAQGQARSLQLLFFWSS